jgi:hypothetical protein
MVLGTASDAGAYVPVPHHFIAFFPIGSQILENQMAKAVPRDSLGMNIMIYFGNHIE